MKRNQSTVKEVILKKFISLSIVMFIIWLLMAGFDANEMILGGLVCVTLAYVLTNYLDISFNLLAIPKIALFLITYIPTLLFELIKANIDVAKRVLNPSLPINPGIVKVPTQIKNEYGRLILANSITLTPGTISLDADDEGIYVHWIDIKGEDASDYQKEISLSFESILRRTFND